nr:hypothetical protein BdHM001_34820 [Bdellovibrio sp. HM001]
MSEICVWGNVHEFIKWASEKGRVVTLKWQSAGHYMTPHIAEVDDVDLLEKAGECPEVAWRFSTGVNFGSPDHRVIVNGKRMYGWEEYHVPGRRYIDLRNFMCDGQPCSTETNIASSLAELSEANGLTLAEFMNKYQPGGKLHK